MKGYVRKRGNKWSFTVDVGRNPMTGKRKQKTKSGFNTKKEATSALNEFIYEVNKGTWIEPQNILFKDFSTEWYENYKHRLRDTTAEQYESKIRTWINPLIGNFKVQEIKPVHAQTFSKNLLSNMEQSTAYKIYAIAKLIMKHAVDLEIISKNPLNNISMIKDKKKKVSTWNFDDLKHFLKVVKKHDEFYYRVFATAAYTGMRKGEVLGLRKSDVDFNKNLISINQSISETKKEGVQISDLKTPSSYRQVAIDNLVSSILKEQIKKNNEMKIKIGSHFKDNDLIFCHTDGIPFRPSSMNRPFKRFIELSGVPYIRFHDMRHTHATLLLELGVNPKIVADRLGHSSVKITLDTYSHPSMDIQADIADLFSKKVQKA